MSRLKFPLKPWLLLLAVILTLASCKKDENNEIEVVNGKIFNLMQEVYLWNDELPARIDPALYATPEDFIEALRYKTYDKWSAVITKDEYNQYFEEGKMIGHGFMLGSDESDNIRVCFLYRFTQATEKGIKRGWIISKVNGTYATSENVFALLGDATLGLTNNITFLDENGATVDISLSKEEVSITPVLHYEVMSQGDAKIGYIVFQDFIDVANDELDEAFTYFTAQGINELIVDLRYNGGGSVDVARYFAGWMIGRNFGNQAFVKFVHNVKYSNWNETLNVPLKSNGLSLPRIFFIGTTNTASASELLINGVKPFVGSILAGSTTHGKPVGMYAFPIDPYDYVALPVAFKYTNKDNEGDFYSGIDPLLPADDDRTHDFGDPAEASLKAVLDYIQTGAVPMKTTKSTGFRVKLIGPDKPVNQYIKAY